MHTRFDSTPEIMPFNQHLANCPYIMPSLESAFTQFQRLSMKLTQERTLPRVYKQNGQPITPSAR